MRRHILAAEPVVHEGVGELLPVGYIVALQGERGHGGKKLVRAGPDGAIE
jgi:hypothetical protein